MSVIFSNGLLAYVWWFPDISAVGRWIMIFVPFFNVFLKLTQLTAVWCDVDGDLNVIHWGSELFVTRVY